MRESWFVFSMSKWPMKILLLVVRAVVYIAQPISFFLWMSISNSQLLVINRTSLVTGFMFAVLMVLFLRIYGGFDIGSKKSKPIIYSMATAIVIADLLSYIVLQIMNVNDMNRANIDLFGSDLLYLFLVILSQFLFISICVDFCNTVLFKINPPKRYCIVTTECIKVKSCFLLGQFGINLFDSFKKINANYLSAYDFMSQDMYER